MASATDPLETILAEVRDAARLSRGRSLRRHAQRYRRDGGALFAACFPPSRPAVGAALAAAGDATATRRLCRALWRDLQRARALPRYLTGRAMRIASLRLLFACECTLYLHQRRQIDRHAVTSRPLSTGEWLTGLCRAIEASPPTPSPPAVPTEAAAADHRPIAQATGRSRR